MQAGDEDVVYDDEEVTPEEKVKKLRAKLTRAVNEKQEYLDGWQRAQADFVNMKRELTERLSRANTEGKEDLLAAHLPSLDALESAVEGLQKSGIPPNVSEGIRNIQRTIFGALAKEGYEPFDGVGEPFDPRKHLSVQVEKTEDSKKDHIVAKVLQKGWKSGERIVRPATVVIYQVAE